MSIMSIIYLEVELYDKNFLIIIFLATLSSQEFGIILGFNLNKFSNNSTFLNGTFGGNFKSEDFSESFNINWHILYDIRTAKNEYKRSYDYLALMPIIEKKLDETLTLGLGPNIGYLVGAVQNRDLENISIKDKADILKMSLHLNLSYLISQSRKYSSYVKLGYDFPITNINSTFLDKNSHALVLYFNLMLQ